MSHDVQSYSGAEGCFCRQAGVYGYGGERSSNWWVSMASLLIGRETSEREEHNLEILNR